MPGQYGPAGSIIILTGCAIAAIGFILFSLIKQGCRSTIDDIKYIFKDFMDAVRDLFKWKG